MNDNRVNYNALVGKDLNGEYVFLDSTFEHSDNFKGATGTTLELIHQDTVDELSTIEGMVNYGYDDSWKMAVEGGHTELGLDDWCQLVLDTDGVESFFDSSGEGYQLIETLEDAGLIEKDQWPLTNCRSGGRCFGASMKFEEVYRPDLIEVINKAEDIVIDISNAKIVDLDKLIQENE
jgi:hypothetical protein